MEQREIICTTCPMGCHVTVTMEDGKILSVKGNTCARGDVYARQEVTDPRRTVTATAATDSEAYPRLPLKSADPVPKDRIGAVLEAIGRLQVRLPIQAGACLLCNAANTGIDIVATRTLPPEE